jgi:glyoxylase I family protein
MLGHILHINVNVTDLERSVAFYESLGFTRTTDFALTAEQAADTCAAFALPPTAFRGAILALGTDANATFVDLIEWADRVERKPAPVNATGPARIAISTPDAKVMLARLEALDIPLLGPPCRMSADGEHFYVLFCVRDPDGTLLEFVG